eukprot:CAMPEP_0171448150 /NCGR_PEP_ID=MMETSP0881-20121228/39471_1 /TAXON_ID=67004 /ORGANISM="Thalassiosira weissflogii, Strain CCMP1336" /LENGTH=344 /DNA_ID=CAMNT_0011972577 /DNA_START=10 /DNA_END=1041 /DNA_ORIENTATION=+
MVTIASYRIPQKDLSLVVSFIVLCALYAASTNSPVSPYLRNSDYIPEVYSRSLLSESEPHSIHQWAEIDLIPVDQTPSTSQHETALFWHIPKSGGTTLKRLYKCFGVSIAEKFGAHVQHHQNDTEIISFTPWPKYSRTTYINVDVSNKEGILHARDLGLVPSEKANIIITPLPEFALGTLFDESHKGRFLMLVRHPIERLVSLFYYLQVATWEKTYRPSWKNATLLQWSKSHSKIWKNFLVKKIIGKDDFTEDEFLEMMETVRKYFVVGLMDEMEESVKRFNAVMKLNVNNNTAFEECMVEFFGNTDGSSEKKNSNEHPKVLEGSPEWDVLAELNSYDMRLYEL